MKQIRIGGVGSILLGDDGIGPYAARWIAANYEFDNCEGRRCAGSGVNVEVEDLGTPGLDLITYLGAVDVLILIDSVANSLPPGSVTVFDRRVITAQRPAVRLDPHSPCITESIFVTELAGFGPQDIYLIGVTPESLEVGTRLSRPVREALPRIARRVLERVLLHGGSYRRRESPMDPAIWWENAEAESIR